uniref:Putative ovule protein n=1 Tax=Solanum chacoense TaxID=4108 RepID=A0A0V0HC27_SOLCH
MLQKLKDCQRLSAFRIVTVCWLGATLRLILLKYATQTTVTLVYFPILHWLVEPYRGSIWTIILKLLKKEDLTCSQATWKDTINPLPRKQLKSMKKWPRSMV